MGKGPVRQLMTALLPHLLLHCGRRVRTHLGAQVSAAGFPVTHVKPQYRPSPVLLALVRFVTQASSHPFPPLI